MGGRKVGATAEDRRRERGIKTILETP